MAEDLEAFLRQAAARRAQRRKPPPQPESRAPQAERRSAEPAPPKRPPVQRTPPDRQSAQRSAQQLTQRHSLESQFGGPQAARAAAQQLGHEVGLADDLLENRLHATFDHRVGQLSLETVTDDHLVEAKQAAAVTAVQIAAQLSSPRSVAQAIVLAEILQRPEHRW